MSDALKIVTHEDALLTKRPPLRVGEPNVRGDADTSRLMDMLGDIDGLKYEIEERMRRIEAVKQAKSVLLEDALRTEALNQKLAEIGKAMSAAQSPIAAAEPQRVEPQRAEPVHVEVPEAPSQVEPGHALVKLAAEGVAIAWPKPEDAFALPIEIQERQDVGYAQIAEADLEHVKERYQAAVDVAEEVTAQVTEQMTETVRAAADAALERLELAEQAWKEALSQVEDATAQAQRVIETSTSQLHESVHKTVYEKVSEAVNESVPAAVHAAVGESVHESVNFAVDEAVRRAVSQVVSREEEATAEARRLLEESRVQLQEAIRREGQMTAEAKRLMDESTARLNQAVSREEQAKAEFQSAHETVASALAGVHERVEQAELGSKRADQAALEAKRLFDESAARLSRAVSKEEQAAADYQAAQKAVTAGYQTASERLEEAERFWRNGDDARLDAKQTMELAQLQFAEAKGKEETATFDLISARQELTTAYQFAAVAAQRRLDAVESFQKSARWAVLATAFSWIATVWMGWLALRATVPTWGPCAVTLAILVLVFVVRKRGAREVGDS